MGLVPNPEWLMKLPLLALKRPSPVILKVAPESNVRSPPVTMAAVPPAWLEPWTEMLVDDFTKKIPPEVEFATAPMALELLPSRANPPAVKLSVPMLSVPVSRSMLPPVASVVALKF